MIKVFAGKKQSCMDIADPIPVNGEYVDMVSAPLCVDINFGNRQASFEEPKNGVLRATNLLTLKLISFRHVSIP